MFEGLKEFFGFTTAAPLQPMTEAPIVPMTPPPATTAEAPVEEEYSQTEHAEKTLAGMLSKQHVEHHGRSGVEKKGFPVGRVSLGESLVNRQHYNMHRSHNIGLAIESDDATPKGETFTISVELSKPVTDFDKTSLSRVLQHIVTKIPSLSGHVHIEEAKPEVTFGDVWAQLKPVIAAKEGAFTAHEIAMLETYFHANTAKFDEPLGHWESGVRASHSDGIVNISINAKELPEDKNAVKSTDEAILAYFHEHHDALLAKVKEKALALGVLKPEDLDHLAMHASANGWDIGLTFGTKPATDIDPATGQKLTPAELAKKMTETPLAGIDTNKLGQIVSEALFESTKELPPITPRIIDPHTISTILRHRLGHDAALEAVISKHDMFKTEEQVKEAAKQHTSNGKIELGEPTYGTTAAGKPVAELEFSLPAGMKVEQVIQELAGNRSQLLLAAQPAQQQLGVAA